MAPSRADRLHARFFRRKPHGQPLGIVLLSHRVTALRSSVDTCKKAFAVTVHAPLNAFNFREVDARFPQSQGLRYGIQLRRQRSQARAAQLIRSIELNWVEFEPGMMLTSPAV